ncbi:MAG: GMC family oxidoreductase [Hyphomicrobiaceae bacterium]
MEAFDYVIVGAGSAGCVLANRLSEDSGSTVCVLEAGPPDWNPYIHIPAGFIKTFYDRSINWCYDMEPSEGTAGRSVYAPRGKTLGGSSAINGHVYNRGQRTDFDTWAQFGNRGWGFSDVLPYFKRIETRIGGGDDRFAGRQGPFKVTYSPWTHPLCEAFMDGCEQLGIPRNRDYNGEIQEGVSYTHRAIYRGRRMSAARAFLHPVKKRSNLAIRTRAHVMNLMFEGKRCTGVRYRKGGRSGDVVEIRANREVILSGGAFNSPQLLKLSGIGTPQELKGHGIDVRHALIGVGENLRDHYAPRFACRVKGVETINERVHGLRLVAETMKWLSGQPSILSIPPTVVYAFWHSGITSGSSDLQITFTPATYKEGVQGQLETEPGFTVAVWQQRPESKGFVRLRSSDPFEAPIIQPNYLAEEIDRRVLLAGMKLARRLMHTDPLKPYVAAESFPGPSVQTDDELMDAGRARGTTTFHPMGTCRMGPSSDPLAVVDDRLRVHGVAGLRIIDASIMPTMLSANLNAATLMIADKGSDMIRGREPLEAETSVLAAAE